MYFATTIAARYLQRCADAKNGKKTGDRTGVGLFIPLPALLAEKFPSLGDEDKSPPHVTFLYIGEVPEEKEAIFLKALSEAFQGKGWPKVRARLDHLDYFQHPDKVRNVAHMAVRFGQPMAELRERVRNHLENSGIGVADSFPVYRPHTTLAYLPTLTSSYGGDPVYGEWDFDTIEVWGLPRVHKIHFNPNARDAKERILGRLARGKKPSAFDREQLAKGTKVEFEHTDNREVAREIAMDHLTEDPAYYKKLDKIEKHALRYQAKGRYDHINFKPPESVAKVAEKGLEYRKRQGKDKAGLTPGEASKEGIGSGVQRASNLKNRTNVSPKVIRQMVAFFSRHEKNKAIDAEYKNEPWKDKGYVSWCLWGGDPGKAWAEKVLRQMDAADKEKSKPRQRGGRLKAAGIMQLGPARVDQERSAKLRKMKLKSRYTPSSLNGALLSAAYHAKRQGKTMFVFEGNSFMHHVFRVSFKPSDYLNPINNTGDQVISVDPDLTVSWYDVKRASRKKKAGVRFVAPRSCRTAFVAEDGWNPAGSHRFVLFPDNEEEGFLNGPVRSLFERAGYVTSRSSRSAEGVLGIEFLAERFSTRLSEQRVAALYLARVERMDLGRIEKLRKDFLMLMKNAKIVKDYDQAWKWREAVVRWRDHFDLFALKKLRQSIKDLRFQERVTRSDATYWDKKLGSDLWDLYLEMRVPLEPLALLRHESPGRSVEDLKAGAFAKMKQELRRWDGRVRRAARKAWKVLKEFAQWYQMRSEAPIGVDMPADERMSMEGFSVMIKGFDPDSQIADLFAEGMEQFKTGLKRYKQRAEKVMPLLLRAQLPLVVDFQMGVDEGGVYKHNHIDINPMAAHKNPGRMAQIIAHEMGHHIYKTYLSKQDQEFWSRAITGNYGTLDLNAVLRKYGNEGSLFDNERIKRENPILYLQIQGLYDMVGADRVFQNILSMDSLREYLAEGGQSDWRVHSKPITGYAHKNNEEAFCEALGMLVGYGPRAVLPEVRPWLRTILGSQIKIARQHRNSLCMEKGCKRAPEIECIWAEGMGRAWFCKPHFKEWSTKGDGKGEGKGEGQGYKTRKEAGIIAYPPKMAEDILAWVKSLYASWVATQARVMVRLWKSEIKDYKNRLKLEQETLAEVQQEGNAKEIQRTDRAVQYTQQSIREKQNEIKDREKVLTLAKADGAIGRGKKKAKKDFPVDLTGLPANYPVDLMTGIRRITVTVEFTGKPVSSAKHPINGQWDDASNRLRLLLHGRPPEQRYTYVNYLRRMERTLQHELQHMVQRLFFLFEVTLMNEKLKDRGVDWERLSPKQQQHIRDAIKKGLPREYEPGSLGRVRDRLLHDEKAKDPRTLERRKRVLYFLDPREFFTWIGNTERDFIETLRMNRKEFIETLHSDPDPNFDPKPTREDFDRFVGNPRPVKGTRGFQRTIGDPISTHPFFAALWEHDKPRWRRAVKELWKRVHNRIVMPASVVAKRYQARKVAGLYRARQFTLESWAKYKRKHPGAKEKDHDIVKPEASRAEAPQHPTTCPCAYFGGSKTRGRSAPAHSNGDREMDVTRKEAGIQPLARALLLREPRLADVPRRLNPEGN